MKNKHLIINLFFALISPSIAYAEINQEINYKTRGEESSSFFSKQTIDIEKQEFIFDRGKCNEGIEEVCEKLLQSSKDVGGQITNPLYRDTFLEKQKQIDEIKRRREEMELKIVRCRRLIKENLKDPSSFKILNSYSEQVRTGIVRYSATNSFGARVQEVFDCNRL